MALLGHIVKRYLKIRNNLRNTRSSPRIYQNQQLRRLLEKAKNTSFGIHYTFEDILQSEKIYEQFKSVVPFHNYNTMYKRWWRFCQEGEKNVCWPGKVKYFALSSGTSESASKHIPVTEDMIRSVKKTGARQFVSMHNFNLPSDVFGKGILMLGGTTSLFERGDYYEGDMSGISAKKMPRWLSYLFYKPGQSISKRPRWEERIQLIVEKAKSWDVSIIAGVPAWVQIVLQEIVNYHKVENIHEIWPHLSLYIHGGVSFEPYKESFQKLLGQPITFIETYMASEGSFGFQARPNTKGIQLVTNNSIFYEFVPFNQDNFTEDGEIKKDAEALMIHEVVKNKDYAVVLSTCSGAWRYLIGDVIRFTNTELAEIIIVGRTKQFLSLCGEHMSVDNMNRAIEVLQQKLNITISEFTVAGYIHENLFAHTWYLGCDDMVDAGEAQKIIDQTLIRLNDDYATERESALKEVFVEVLPSSIFLKYLEEKGKIGAMNKFPRVMKGNQLEQWRTFVEGEAKKNSDS